MIQITVDTRRAVVTNKELLTKGSAGIQVRFTLSEDWAGLAKVAVFRQGDDGERVDCVLDSGLTCVVPPEVLTIEDEVVFCGVYGSNGQGSIIIPTVWASLGVVRPGTEPNTPAAAEPTPEIWAQILGVAQDAEATADEAMSLVEAGLTNLSVLEEMVGTAEASRVLAEQDRVDAESARAQAETDRAAEFAIWESTIRGSLLTDRVKNALFNIFRHVAYIDDNGQDYYDELYKALKNVTVTSISCAYTQSKIVYDSDPLDVLKSDLAVNAVYSDGSSGPVPSSDYTFSGTLSVGTSTITVFYGGKTDTFSVTVTHWAEYSVTNNLTNCTNSNGDSTVIEGENYSGTITANAGYSMTGATVIVTMGGTDITSTVYRNGTVSIASVSGNIVINASAVAVTLSSISVVFTQGQTVVYNTDSLDVLKPMLTVTATYSDSTTAIIPSTDYTLSGTLAEGTSTITVSYGGKTDTFNVTVTAAPVSTALYDWDFKNSLMDSVSGVVATTTATRDSNGLTFTELDTYLDLGAVYSRDRTYEIDISYIGEPNSGSTAYRRIFAFGTNGTQTDSDTAAFIVPMGAYRPGWYFYLGSSWDSAAISPSLSSETQYNYFDGKTMKIYLDSSGYAHVYEKTIGADDSAYTFAGESHGALNAFNNTAHVYIGGSAHDRIAYSRVTGFRIYEGEK